MIRALNHYDVLRRTGRGAAVAMQVPYTEHSSQYLMPDLMSKVPSMSVPTPLNVCVCTNSMCRCPYIC